MIDDVCLVCFEWFVVWNVLCKEIFWFVVVFGCCYKVELGVGKLFCNGN